MAAPKTKEYYISLCRYYQGDGKWAENTPRGAEYEKNWVDFHFSEHGMNVLRESISDYKLHGLGSFMKDDGTPISLKALLFNRYAHWNYSPDGFRDWYKQNYLQISPLNS